MALAEIYHKIGIAGGALVVVSLLALYFSVKNISLLYLINKDFRKRFKRVEAGTASYSEELHKPSNPLSGVIAEMVEIHATHSDDIRAEVAYLFHRNFSAINRDIAWLKLIAAIAPLMGLLGTMLGMVGVFAELAGGNAGDAARLADGIWEALLTTIMGLAVAIPTLVAYYYLSLKMRGFHIEVVEHSYRAIDLFARNRPHAEGLNTPAAHTQKT